MATTFVSEDVYGKVFRIGPAEKAALQRAARDLWRDCSFLNENPGEDIKVVCVGYGSGWRDFPALLALRDQVDEIAQLRGCAPRRIAVLAIEPEWNKQVDFAGGELTLQSEQYSDEHRAVVRILECRGIRIELVKSTIEEWQRNAPNNGSKLVDIVMVLCVLHLLDNWKETLAYFDERLREGGAVVLSETPGKVSYFDGQFLGTPDPNDNWEQVWRTVYSERDSLLLPGTKIVAPRDMFFLKGAFGDAGYLPLKEVGISVESKITGSELEDFIRSICGGADAKTLGAFRIYDRERANLLVENTLGKVGQTLATAKFNFDTGYRFFGFIKPAGGNHLLAKTVCRAARSAAAEAIERKTTIKKALKGRHDDEAHTYAVASILYDMREALALSRETFIVATTKENGEYIGAVQLPPLSLVGSSDVKKRLAHNFVSRHALYLSDQPKRHLSHLFDTDFGDLAVQITAVADSNSPVSQAGKSVYRNTDGCPCYIEVEIKEDVFLYYRNEMDRCLADFLENAAEHLNPGSFPGWSSADGLRRFFFGSEPSLIQSTFAALAPSDLDRVNNSRRISDALLAEIIQPIEDKLHASGLPESRAIAEALANSLRLALVEWRHESVGLPWRSCFYIMRKVARESGHTGVSALILLDECDSSAWKAAGFASQATPLLVTAVEPFLNAIQEVESARLAQRKGWKEGVGRTLDDLSHELSKQTTVLFENRLQSVSRLFEVNNLPRANNPDDPRDWPKPAGKISVPAEYEQMVSEWLVCPVPKLLDSLKDYLFLWAGTSASTPHFCIQSDSIEHFVRAALGVANSARVASVMKDFSPQSIAAVEQTTRLHQKHLGDSSKAQIVFELHGATIVSPNEQNEKHHQLILSEVFRAIVAAISNALEHNTGSDAPISIHVSCSSDRLEISVRNKLPNGNQVPSVSRRDGTRAVISNSLAHLGIRNADVHFGKDPTDAALWLTRFSVGSEAQYRCLAVRWLAVDQDNLFQ